MLRTQLLGARSPVQGRIRKWLELRERIFLSFHVPVGNRRHVGTSWASQTRSSSPGTEAQVRPDHSGCFSCRNQGSSWTAFEQQVRDMGIRKEKEDGGGGWGRLSSPRVPINPSWRTAVGLSKGGYLQYRARLQFLPVGQSTRF